MEIRLAVYIDLFVRGIFLQSVLKIVQKWSFNITSYIIHTTELIMMNLENTYNLFKDISVWKQGAQRAPHKPLLLLIALAKLSRNEPRLFHFEEIENQLTNLLIEYGPHRKTIYPNLPFWYLRNDGIWELSNCPFEADSRGKKAPSKRYLLKHQSMGGFTSEVYEQLKGNHTAIAHLATLVLEAHFPDTYHEDILLEVGLCLDEVTIIRRRRDPNFREKIIKAYESKCVICGYDLRLGTNLVGLEAAHIKWHKAGGEDIESNGLALCAIHHKLFDRGVYTIEPDSNIIRVSEFASSGGDGMSRWLLDFHGQPIRKPVRSSYLPDPQWVTWHQREVFKPPAREIVGI